MLLVNLPVEPVSYTDPHLQQSFKKSREAYIHRIFPYYYNSSLLTLPRIHHHRSKPPQPANKMPSQAVTYTTAAVAAVATGFLG